MPTVVPGPKKIAEGAGGNAELFVAGDRRGFGARGDRRGRNAVGVGQTVNRRGECGDIADVIVAGILAIEEIEKIPRRAGAGGARQH